MACSITLSRVASASPSNLIYHCCRGNSIDVERGELSVLLTFALPFSNISEGSISVVSAGSTNGVGVVALDAVALAANIIVSMEGRTK